MLYCAWRHGNMHPYDTYNDTVGAQSPYPERVKTLLFGFALVAEERWIEMTTGRAQRRQMGA